MFWSKLRCHFCGSRSPHAAGVPDFQCLACEAINYLDSAGNIVDPPTAAMAQTGALSSERVQTFTRPLPESLDHQQHQAFCRTCLQNQHLYNETLANYLPDESHPEYREYEKAIPEYKKELEKRYPLVCTKCAPKAQTMINRGDYYALTQNVGRLCHATRMRNGQPAHRTRDDAGKKTMRFIYRLIGFTLFLGLLSQITYHAYAILTILFGTAISEPDLTDITDIMFQPSFNECAHQSLGLHFSNTCYQLFGHFIPYTLALAAACLWYNPGLKQWYHHTHRMEAVNGQKNYFYMQLMILAVRCWAWYTLSDPHTATQLDKEQLIAAHGFPVFFILVAHAVAKRGIQPVLWTMKGKMMPKPSEFDVLGANAGPSPEHYTPKASEKDPFRYFRKETGPIDLSQYGKKPTNSRPTYYNSRPTYHSPQQPSPEYSDDDEDAMEVDNNPIMLSSQRSANVRPNLQPRHTYNQNFNYNQSNNHGQSDNFAQSNNYGQGNNYGQNYNYNRSGSTLSFGGDMTDQVFGMQTQMRAEEERQRIEQEKRLQHRPSAFYTKIPPAPMSMERRLRNPPTQPLEPEKIPLSQQRDFMAKMREGIKPVQFPQRGSNFEVKKSTWHLPSDSKEVGFEERFMKTFSLNDPSPVSSAKPKGIFGGWFGR